MPNESQTSRRSTEKPHIHAVASEVKPRVSIPWKGYDKPRHACKTALSGLAAGTTNRDTAPHGQRNSPSIGTQASRTGAGVRSQIAAVLSAACLLVVPAKAEGHCYHHKSCWKRVHAARAKAWLWRQFHHHPMPYCTWGPESGPGNPWRPSRYRAKNSQSTAGGKFQILDTTWYAHGGRFHRSDGHVAAYAPPLEQEKVARRVLAGQGPRAWVNC